MDDTEKESRDAQVHDQMHVLGRRGERDWEIAFIKPIIVYYLSLGNQHSQTFLALPSKQSIS